MKARNLSAEVHEHIKHNKWDMVKDILLIVLTALALCAVIAWMRTHPELLDQIK